MLKEIVETIKDSDTIWVMENKENNDRIFKEYISDMLFSSSYIIVAKGIAYVFVHRLDEGNIGLLDKKYSKVYIYETYSELTEQIAKVLKKLDYPKNMLLSYTTMQDENADIISYSSYKRVAKMFRNLYKEAGNKVKIKSSEQNIYEVLSKYTENEVEKLKLLAKATDKILALSFESIKEGQSEIEIQNNTIKIMHEYLDKNMKALDLVSYNFAWDNDPIVLVGENLQKGGHAIPSEYKIKKGDTIYFDFGIKGEFSDGTILYTDMQRMGYMLKKEETEAPVEVQEVFDTLIDSISFGMELMYPGVKAYKVDAETRGTILDAGYPNYPHATGHPVGHEVHGAGALISVRSSKRANLRLIEGGIYTLEPRVNIPNGGSIEEMIMVTKDGAKPLCDRQLKLILI